MNRDGLPEWARPYDSQIRELAGRLRGEQVVRIRRGLRNARLAEELAPGGVVVELAACDLEELDASSRAQVEDLRRRRPGARVVVLSDLDGAVAFDGGATKG